MGKPYRVAIVGKSISHFEMVLSEDEAETIQRVAEKSQEANSEACRSCANLKKPGTIQCLPYLSIHSI